MPEVVSIHPKTPAQDKIYITTAEVSAELRNILNKFFNLISLYTNIPTKSAYTTATPAASVGVKIPP
ncbi:hypothetical protein SDC9_176323 [bioreactor metagenome]|uniref:Uncharacterized protein n=1 Tax=bioreactor metagenome TaxID=1076179 RepID=A0A645GPN5_9ZZZZ